MSNKYILFSYAIALAIEFVAAMQLFDGLFEQKIKTSRKYLLGTGLMVINFLFLVFAYDVTLNIIVHFWAVFIIAKVSYFCGLKSSILSSLYYTVIMVVVEFATMAVLLVSDNSNFDFYAINGSALLFEAIFGKLFLLLVVKLSVPLGLYFNRSKKKSKTPAFLFIFPICSMVIVYTFWEIASEVILPKRVQMTIIISGLAAVLSVILTYVFYSKTSKELDELHEKEREADRVKADVAYYELLDRQNNILKTFIHDEKNHLSAIKSIADNDEVNEYIDKVYGKIQSNSSLGNTGNKMLDLMINKYQYICENEKIDFYFSIKTANLSFIENSDLISMLGNLLDNAVEAARLSERKSIDFSINKSNGFDVLTLINSADNKPVFRGKNLITTKSDYSSHGLGMRSVKKTVEKYDGDFDWNYDDAAKEFTVIIAFKDKKFVDIKTPEK